MKRKEFVRLTGMLGAGTLLSPAALWSSDLPGAFPEVRVAAAKRKFSSAAVEKAIEAFDKKVSNRELAWLFRNCFPNTLDTTVDFEMINGRPDTYVITGDIDAMWLRDSTAQVWPYLGLLKEDPRLKDLIAGVINRQAKNIVFDPYANAFYKDTTHVSEWKDDATDMKPGIHERKWEIDSLCYPVRLAYHYWKQSGDVAIFDAQWKTAAVLIVKTFREQQRKTGKGPYKFERKTSWATDGVPLGRLISPRRTPVRTDRVSSWDCSSILSPAKSATWIRRCCCMNGQLKTCRRLTNCFGITFACPPERLISGSTLIMPARCCKAIPCFTVLPGIKSICSGRRK
jgi:hypothetical protein